MKSIITAGSTIHEHNETLSVVQIKLTQLWLSSLSVFALVAVSVSETATRADKLIDVYILCISVTVLLVKNDRLSLTSQKNQNKLTTQR